MLQELAGHVTQERVVNSSAAPL